MDTPKVPPIVVSPNLKKTSVRLDINGNEITDFRTKQIIQKAEIEPIAPVVVTTQDTPDLSLKELNVKIYEMEELLDQLKKERREKAKKLRAELEEIEGLE